jgi:hypothetical protein
VGTQVGQPFHSREDPVRLAVFGSIDDLCLLIPGEVGDGRIFVLDLHDVIRIRTDEHGSKAIE